MSLDRLWAGWRTEYVAGAGQEAPNEDACVFCRIVNSGLPDVETHVVHRGTEAFAILNAYPYTSGHLLIMPVRHVADLDLLTESEGQEVWTLLTRATAAIKRAYEPEGMNVGANIGRAAGAGVPGHVHLHVLPRWAGDTNFMTSVTEARVLPEALDVSAQRLRSAWR